MVDIHNTYRLHTDSFLWLTENGKKLHFSNPAAYHDIYNAKVRWDKDEQLYRSFGEDHSSFGFLTYDEAKQRKDVMQPLFSRRAIITTQSLVWQNASLHSL